MMFLTQAGGATLAISQPTHAWVAGRLLREWRTPLDPMFLLAAEQHDLAWIDWERAPVFDPVTGRPKTFLAVGAADHAPLWTLAVERALAAWGRHAALLISRHGCVIYTRFTERHRAVDADHAAATRYIAEQTPKQEGWARSLGLTAGQLALQSGMIALADTLSLGLCGGLPLPLTMEGPGDGQAAYHLTQAAPGTLALHPWPFRAEAVAIAIEATPLPAGRFASEAAMLAWHATAEPVTITLHLVPGAAA